MSQIRILFDVTDLFALLEKDIADIFYRLYQEPWSPNLHTPKYVLWHWVTLTLNEHQSVLFTSKVDNNIMEELGVVLYNQLRLNLHPSYASLLFRLMRLPSQLQGLEGETPTITENHGKTVMELKLHH